MARGSRDPLRHAAPTQESGTRAWSSYGGRWRPVRISYPRVWPPAWGAEPVFAMVCGLAATVAGGVALNWSGAELLATVGDDWSGVWAGILLAAQSAAVLFGLAVAVVAVQDLWASVEITGPILRLRVFDDDGDPRYYAAVDDGSSRAIPAHRLTAEQYRGLRQGQLVTVVATRYLGCVRSIVDAADASSVLESVA